MPFKNTLQRYGTGSMALHWLMLVLIVLAYATIELKGAFAKESVERLFLKDAHMTIGLVILGLLVVRAVWRFAQIMPSTQPYPSQRQQQAAKWGHIGLYGFMFFTPLVGWLMVSAKAKTVWFFGLSVPSLMVQNPEWAERFEEVHEIFGQLGYALIALHTVAALYHHAVLKDNTLLKMWPMRKK